MAASTGTSSLLLAREPGWIYRKSWDLPFLILSAALVPLPFLAAWVAEKSAGLTGPQAIDLVNITVAALVGGPHLFSTATMTFLDPTFRRRHPAYLWSSLFLPALVLYLGIYHYAVLVQFFFAWASVHVLHQMIFLADCYRERANRPDPAWSRGLDYGLILTGLYPVGLYKIAQNEFHVGGVLLRYPEWARPLHLPELAGTLFAALAAAWLVKTLREHARGALSAPKTLLIGLVTVVSFFLPLGRNLDILFQGYNAWHSFQYLFLLWFVNRLRSERGLISGGPLARVIAGRGMLPYYGWLLGATAVLVLLTLVVRAATSLGPDRSYFVVVLSTLLMHYWFDHFLFTRTDMVA